MAQMEKYTTDVVAEICGHNNRSHTVRSNPDIDSSKSEKNYSFDMNHKGLTDYEYFCKRIGEVYVYGRGSKKEASTVTAVSWVISAPKEIIGDSEKENAFFKATYDFVSARYGKENMINNCIHYDEGGAPHIHILFTPVTSIDHDRIHFRSVRTSQVIRTESGRYEFGYRYKKDSDGKLIRVKNYSRQSDLYDEKLSAADVINRLELQHFHADLQTYLTDHHVDGKVLNGSTGSLNISVKDLKEFTKETGIKIDEVKDLDRKKTLIQNFYKVQQKNISLEAALKSKEKELHEAKERISELENEKEKPMEARWGESKEWGSVSVEYGSKEFHPD